MAQLIQRTYVTDPRVGGINAAEIAAAEQQLGMALPAGYDAWMQTFGAGEFEHFVSLAAPADLLQHRFDARRFLQRRGFLENQDPGVGENALKIAWTVDGDLLLALPQFPGTLFYVPRHKNKVVSLANDLVAALAMLLDCPEGDLPQRPVFVPDQACFERRFALPLDRLPYEQVRAALCHSLAFDHIDEVKTDFSSELFLCGRSFFGAVVCHEDDHNLQVVITAPIDQTDQIAPILACLKALGFMDEPTPPKPLTPAESAKHERIVYVTHNYHYLAGGRFRDISLSRERPRPAQQQLYAMLLRDYNDQIVFNPCPACGRQRRTPRARQCLNCGTHSEP